MTQCRGKTHNGTRCHRKVTHGSRCHQHRTVSQRGGGDGGVVNGFEPTEVLLFFAPWCHFCHQFMDGSNSVWEQIKRKYAQSGDVKFTQIDCDANPEKAREFDVVGFPTIYKAKGSTLKRFEGNRTVEEMDRFIRF